ncbi:MAG: glutamine synthetase type III [Ruminococcaceae bacterium]|nr:glutamine synthetase type III [Oscillospiraceae bacterium]
MDISAIFGSKVFNDTVMRERLPKDIYKAFKAAVKNKKSLDLPVANAIAHAMKEWAIENGATHYAHWFQPMTGITAEKHDSFISPVSDSLVIMEFSGKELIKSEPDASSFPSGGLRATFEARGYTNWDPTSYAFIKDNTLCIPTAFCSYGGEALDKKTPLLRSMECVDRATERFLKALGEESDNVYTTIGAEQEYFLIDRDLFKKRRDLVYTGRTLFGAKPPKGQELDDHYFGTIRPRVLAYMQALDEELWKLGILAKTEHNEAAPSQHELAPIFTNSNVAVDHNQLTMEIMKRMAAKFELACLLHEKPFESVNGSGKHVNWSISQGDRNLFKPGDKPHENISFLMFLIATIKAVDEYQDLIRLSAASAGNDHRLGACEAPPAIVSVFIGSDLEEILECYERGVEYCKKDSMPLETGVHALPVINKDGTDRNRTSPFAFTGNKFEFRMPGSSFSVADPAMVLNTVVADVLIGFSERLEGADDKKTEAKRIIAEEYKNHKRVVFNGNNYSEEWREEAKRRGLMELRTTVDALPRLLDEKNVSLYVRHGIFTRSELESRFEMQLENYSKIINIEALTMINMSRKDIAPAVEKYLGELGSVARSKLDIGISRELCPEIKAVEMLSSELVELIGATDVLESLVRKAGDIGGEYEKAEFFKDEVIPAMNKLRKHADTLEENVDRRAWPIPSYGELMFSF